MEEIFRDSEIQYGTTKIKFRLHYSSRKTLGVEVHPNRSVQVIAPEGANYSRILKKVEEKAPWIQKQIRKYSKIENVETEREFVSGENVFYLGRQYRLKVRIGKPKVRLIEKYLMLTIPDKSDKKQAEELIDNWYNERAVKVISNRFARFQYISDKEKIKVNKVAIKKLEKRWGSCTKLGTISFNINLIKTPINCIDYVIVHELCHLKHLNHSPKFYKMLMKYFPKWEEAKSRLNKF